MLKHCDSRSRSKFNRTETLEIILDWEAYLIIKVFLAIDKGGRIAFVAKVIQGNTLFVG